MSERQDVGLVGSISPGEDGAAPLFKIIRSEYDLDNSVPNVRPCPHPNFVLDEKFSTVTCGECHERLQPFDILLLHAKYWEEIKRKEVHADNAEWNLHRAELRRLRRLRALAADEAEEIDTALRGGYCTGKSKELRELSRKINRSINRRKYGT